MWSIYKHTFPNGKVYIGLTKQEPRIRFKNGYGYESCPLMWNAIKKYGWDSIVTTWLETNIATLQSAAKLEQKYIAQYDSTNYENGYNLANGGQGGATYKYNYENIMKYWNDGLNISEISKIMGCSSITVRRILDKYNIPSSERRKRQNYINGENKTKYDYSEIVKLWEQGLTCKEIELKIGCCRGTIRIALNKKNVSLDERERVRKEHSSKAICKKYNSNAINDNHRSKVAELCELMED